MSSILTFLPEALGLTGTAATVASAATGVGLAAAAKSGLESMVPDVPDVPEIPEQETIITSPQVGAAQQVQSEAAAEAEDIKKRRGRSSTIRTSGLGLLTSAPLSTKKLLGQ